MIAYIFDSQPDILLISSGKCLFRREKSSRHTAFFSTSYWLVVVYIQLSWRHVGLSLAKYNPNLQYSGYLSTLELMGFFLLCSRWIGLLISSLFSWWFFQWSRPCFTFWWCDSVFKFNLLFGSPQARRWKKHVPLTLEHNLLFSIDIVGGESLQNGPTLGTKMIWKH